MRDYGQLQLAFWTDRKVRSWTDAQKVLAAYLVAGPHTTSLGCYFCPLGYIATDLNWTTDKAIKTVSELSGYGFVTVDDGSGYVFVHRFLKHNRADNGNVAKHVAKLFNALPPDVPMRGAVAKALDAYGAHLSPEFMAEIEPLIPPDGDGSGTVCEPYRNKEQEQDRDQEQDHDQDQDRDQDDCSAPQSDAQPLHPPFIAMPVTGEGGNAPDEPIQVAEVEQWRRDFPGVDVQQHLRNMRAWLANNPTRRKTRKGVRRFITNWLTKEQNSGRGGGGGVPGSRNQAAADAAAEALRNG